MSRISTKIAEKAKIKRCVLSQIQLHKNGPWYGVQAVGSDLAKSQPPVHFDGCGHGLGNCIQEHAAVTRLSRFANEALRQGQTNTMAAMPGFYIQTFHLADGAVIFMLRGFIGKEFVQSTAAGGHALPE